ncbi:MAG: hypothetical protein ACYCWW_13625 [Deltaproteobacteria bacterium]
MRRALAALLLAALAAGSALAHLLPGVARMRPGSPFNWFAMRQLAPPGYGESDLEFEKLRGERALAFLVIDPYLPADLAQAHRFERLARALPHTTLLLVASAPRSQETKRLSAQAARERFSLPLLVDRRDVFPYAFGFGLSQSPRYELFDRSWTLTVQNGHSLQERLPDGETIEGALRALDRGERLLPTALP